MATYHPIEDVVNVIISLGTRPIDTSSFDIPLVLVAHNVWSDDVRTYSSASDLLTDGFASGSSAYLMAQDLFAGDFAPTEVKIARRALTQYEVNFTVLNETDYTVALTVNTGAAVFAKTYTFTSDVDATNIEIATGLALLIESDVDVSAFVVADGATGTLTLAPQGVGQVSAGFVTDNMVVTSTSPETVATAMARAEQSTSSFFFLLCDSHTDTDIEAMAAYAESNRKIYVTSDDDADVITSATTDIASDLQDNSYNNTLFVASKDASTQFPEAAVVGAWAGTNPGSSTLWGKTLKGVSIQDYTATEAGFAKSKNANVYINRGKVGFFEDGQMASGQFADIIRGALWLEITMEEDIFAFLKRKSDLGKKVPYTDLGISMIGNVMRKRLDIGVKNGFLESYKLLPPKAADQPDNDKANRVLADFPFEATVAGAFQDITIRGYLTV